MAAIGKVHIPYSSKQDLYSEVSVSWSKIYKEAGPGVRLEPPKKEVSKAFQAYKSAMDHRMPLVILGVEEIREDVLLIGNFGTLATDPQYDQKKIKQVFEKAGVAKGKELNELALDHLTTGAIVNDSNWWIFRNDMFILGAIHANKDFHIAYKGMKSISGVPADELLWDNDNKRPRALGRELLMLRFAGYTPVISRVFGKRGISFVPPEGSSKLSLTEMRELIKRSGLNDIKLYLSNISKFEMTPSPSPSPTDFIPTSASSKDKIDLSSLENKGNDENNEES